MPEVYGQVTISWNRNGEADLAGYKIYFGTTALTLSPMNTAQFPNGDVGLTPTPLNPSVVLTVFPAYGTVFFAVGAYDTSNNLSALSTPVVNIAVAPKLMPLIWP